MNDIPKSKTIKAWSFSRLVKFEECPYTIYLAAIKKEAKPEPVEGEKESAGDRGTRIHQEAEDYVRGTIHELPTTLKKLEKDFTYLKTMYAEGKVELEEDWGFDRDWNSTGYFDDNIWLRVKCDVVIHHDKTQATVIDHKTGKSWGNEVKHMQQGQLYAVAAFMKYPDLERIDVEIYYIDEGKIKKKSYSRDKFLRYLERFTERGLRVTTTIDFRAKPNIHNCRFCDYGPNKGTGACPYGVEP